ncbi:hypothetical protein ACFE04_030294 [Oxalis oulophora]
MSLIFFLLLFPLTIFSFPYKLKYHIDCGNPTSTTDAYNTTWQADTFYTGGSTSTVSEPLHFHHPQEKTLRYFPLSSGKKNCYVIPVPSLGRYYVRTFIVYDNYDGKLHAPSFDVSVEGNLVFSWRSPWDSKLARDGAYSDLFVTVEDGELDLCFYSIATDPPVIGSLTVIQIDPEAYGGGNGNILVNYGRLSSGSGQWGPGFSNDKDDFGRSWQSDRDFRSNSDSGIRVVGNHEKISNTDRSPNYFPMKLYQTGVMSAKVVEYSLDVDAKMDYLLWFHFAEIDSSVTKPGQRVFDILVNDKNVTRIDIVKNVGSFAAYDWSYVVKNLSSTTLIVQFVPVVGSVLVSGIENYALVPADLSTIPEQVIAMRSLKDSLRIPGRMGWNGDPCAPTNWDAWEGVTCRPNNVSNSTALVISQIDLGSQGLRGYISEQIYLLTDLVTLNLSSNSLEGRLPSGLGHKSLTTLDLSNNQFTGSIPDSLTTSSLKLMILNGNLLEGRVPEQLYSIGVHGGEIDLSGNKGLCGVPSLPDCSLIWENGGLSTGGKIAIGLSCFLFVALLLFAIICFIRRRRHDYDFALPHELMSLSAKRNRYQRQKSLMVLEMESQHAKFTPS